VIVRVNGRETELAADAMLVEAVRAAGADPGERGIAASLDGEVVPRARWDRTPLPEGAVVEVVRATAGG
jgi:thiamine biosynthesis protein ThiS